MNLNSSQNLKEFIYRQMRFLLLMVSCFVPPYVVESHYTKIYANQYCFAALVRNNILLNIVNQMKLRNRMNPKRWYYVRFRLKSEFSYYAEELYSCLKRIDSRMVNIL